MKLNFEHILKSFSLDGGKISNLLKVSEKILADREVTNLDFLSYEHLTIKIIRSS